LDLLRLALQYDFLCGMLQPCASTQADANADARLIELEEKIFELIHAMDEFEPEMSRLQQVWTSESIRL
jgi:hypothetical protein